jgi:hypothetical protein
MVTLAALGASDEASLLVRAHRATHTTQVLREHIIIGGTAQHNLVLISLLIRLFRTRVCLRFLQT